MNAESAFPFIPCLNEIKASSPMFQSYRKQTTDLQCKSINWIPYNCNTARKWDKITSPY